MLLTNRISFALVLILLIAAFSFSATAQSGCTDSQALNYDPAAVINDGSCLYPATTLSTSLLAPLQTPLLDESSGLFNAAGNLWTHVDDTYEELHAIDTNSGIVLRTVTLAGTTNLDWEEAQVDSSFIYVGDIGNNAGARPELFIYRYPLSVLDSASPVVYPDTIRFSFSDQTDFTPALNNTRFDCEAFVVAHDTIHLFSKDWVLKNTRRYTLPAIPGNHVAQLRDSLAANGLITGASITTSGVLVLLGYDNQIPAPCFLWMFHDYQQTDFFSGNKRRFSLGTALTLGQTEAITFGTGNYGYITNERFQQSIFNVAPQLRSFSLDNYLTQPNTAQQEIQDIAVTQIYPQPALGSCWVKTAYSGTADFRLWDIQGRLVFATTGSAEQFMLRPDNISPGSYVLEISCKDGRSARSRVMFH